MAEVTQTVYDALRSLAHRQLRKNGGNTLNTTALVHEAWLKLARAGEPFASRGHFFAVVATAMRHILVDHARRRGSRKRGENPVQVDSVLPELGGEARMDDVLAIDRALDKLAELDERLARVVEWRFFGGLEETEIATGLGVDAQQARRRGAPAALPRRMRRRTARPPQPGRPS